MIKHICQVTVETDIEEDSIYITQVNPNHEDGRDFIVLDPCQIDLFIKLLQHAKEDFIGHTKVEQLKNTDIAVHSK